MKTSLTNCFEFLDGSISASKIAQVLQHGTQFHDSGAYSVFMGQVRNDIIKNKTVRAINYTANVEMAKHVMTGILDDAFNEFDTKIVHVLHSLGEVSKGEICLLVMVVCGHRKESFRACEYIVERLKKELPVWGQEILEDNTHTWKINK
ncbi:MAG: molybdenum cofactor biosynthesis protein MoaE [Bacteroidia bacterium]|nr:molybdenum cofactor biosynthesis protein MoaE [Bacteroidia bacterium]